MLYRLLCPWVESRNGLMTFERHPGGNDCYGTSNVPGPATLILLGLGIAGMAGYGWRRKQRVTAFRRPASTSEVRCTGVADQYRRPF